MESGGNELVNTYNDVLAWGLLNSILDHKNRSVRTRPPNSQVFGSWIPFPEGE